MATTQVLDADDRVKSARTAWLARFVGGGVPVTDFFEVTGSITRWQDWCSAWSARAAIHEGIGREALAGGFGVSAAQHLTTAALCYHFGKYLFCGYPEEMRAAHMKAVECRNLALPYLSPPGERVAIPYEGKYLYGNLRRPLGMAKDARPPVLIIVAGMDSAKEEFHNAEQLFLERGMATFSFDGPGQGEAEYDFPIRHDYEVPCGVVMDWIATRDDLDHTRIGLSGVSMGAYYVPRVAAKDKRVTACIVNGGAFDVLDNFDRRPDITKETYLLRTHSKTMAEAREKTAPFTLEGIAQEITCPIFIIGSKSDDITRYTDAERLSREVSGSVELLLIEGASHVAHNRAHLFKTQSADWMAANLNAV
jgi:pimeloyl-ACP methyl ester carboxylesterase